MDSPAAVAEKGDESSDLDNHEEEDEEEEAEFEILGREIEALKDQHEAALRDSKALIEGTSVWKSACDTLTALEQTIITICTTIDAAQQKPRIEQALNTTVQKLEELLQVVVTQNWGLLNVALSHELEAIYLSQNLINGNGGKRTTKSGQQQFNQQREESTLHNKDFEQTRQQEDRWRYIQSDCEEHDDDVVDESGEHKEVTLHGKKQA